MKENNKTKAWELYERGRLWNERLTPSQYALVKTNTEFFTGNQWLGLPDTPAMRGLPKPIFNILKRVATLFIASLTSEAVSVRFEPLAYYDGVSADPDHDVAEFANAEVANLLEKFKFEYRLRDALFDGAQTGDYCAHFWFDPDALPYRGALGEHRGEIRMELVDGVNVLFGNPGDRRIDHQPYILIAGRDTVLNLRREAELHRSRTGSLIRPDLEYADFPGIGGTTEILSDDESGKALYLYLYTMKEKPERDPAGTPTGRTVRTVHVTKATRTAVIYEDVDTGLSRYPIAWGNWETQKNQYHGRALITGLLPNQIFINSMFATAMRHMQLMAFPKTVYNADLISAWTNEVGQAIGVHGLQPGMSVGQVAANLQPAEMSSQIFALIDKAMAYTKECLGATDAILGSARPDNTSALMVLQTNSEVPLENIRAGLYEWIEDIAAVLLDMMGTYYGLRPVVVEQTMEEPVTGPGGIPLLDPVSGLMQTAKVTRKVIREFDFRAFKDLYLAVRVDVGASAYWSEIAVTQTLDNLRREGTLDVIQYLERIPDKLIPRKQELIDELRSRIPTADAASLPADPAMPSVAPAGTAPV